MTRYFDTGHLYLAGIYVIYIYIYIVIICTASDVLFNSFITHWCYFVLFLPSASLLMIGLYS